MEEVLIVIGAATLLLFLTRSSGRAPAPAPSTLPGARLVSGGYQVLPPSTALGINSAYSPTALPTAPSPLPPQPPPSAVLGGLPGTVGTGGAPLGGRVVGGVSTGTGTSSSKPRWGAW